MFLLEQWLVGGLNPPCSDTFISLFPGVSVVFMPFFSGLFERPLNRENADIKLEVPKPPGYARSERSSGRHRSQLHGAGGQMPLFGGKYDEPMDLPSGKLW
jgi:hypothetical protein